MTPCPERPVNFGAGPGMLPLPVLQQAAQGLLDWKGCGLGVMEMSHRSEHFESIIDDARARLRALLQVPEHFHILFQQGGGTGQNALVPLNLAAGGVIDFVVTGAWSQKSCQEASRYARKVRVAASGQADGFTRLPAPSAWQLSPDAAYVHLCSNETIHGVQFADMPDLAALGSGAPLVVDCSSDIASRPFDWTRVGLAFAGAQKNLGAAGLTLVFVREDLLGRALPACPSAFDYTLAAEHHSLYNTPPTWGIYILGLMLDWIAQQREGNATGVDALAVRNQRQAQALYAAIDASQFYENRVEPAARSQMNVPFFLADTRREADFLAGAARRGLLQLQGHASTGGMRASLYNAMTDAGVTALVSYLREFEQQEA